MRGRHRNFLIVVGAWALACPTTIALADHDGIGWRPEPGGAVTFFVGNTNFGALNLGPVGGIVIDGETFPFDGVFAIGANLPIDVVGDQRCVNEAAMLPYTEAALRWQYVTIGDDVGEPSLSGLVSVTTTATPASLVDQPGSCFPLDIDLDPGRSDQGGETGEVQRSVDATGHLRARGRYRPAKSPARHA